MMTKDRLHQVADVEAVFNALRADVEALFMTAPSVNLEAITQGIQDVQALVREEVWFFLPCGVQTAGTHKDTVACWECLRPAA